MAEQLTDMQKLAVENRGGKLLVSAAAGSGKTKVLVDRLMLYLTDPVDPADLDEFLIITYTKAAAAELRGKIAAKLTQRIAEEPENKHLQKQMQRLFLTKISTVHGFCGDILREYAYRLDLPADFRVADENECQEIREQVLRDLLEQAYEEDDAEFQNFISTQGLGRDDRVVPDLIEKVYDSAMCHLDPDAWLDACMDSARIQGREDVSETTWGQDLIAELMDYLAAQIRVLEQCVRDAQMCDGLEKVTANIQDTLEQYRLLHNSRTWDEILVNKNIDYKRFPTIKKCGDPELLDRIRAARDASKTGLQKQLKNFADPSEQVLADMAQCADSIDGLVKLVRRFQSAYTRVKNSRRCLDFSDLEHRTLDLLLGKSRSNPTAAAAEIEGRFREILVDEYQDSNAVQDAIFTVLTRKRENCFMVGDVKQSIYQFRLADPEIFLKKYHDYGPAETTQSGGRKVLLSDNFRSGGEIVEAVNHVFRSCMSPRVGGLHYGEGEALREGIRHEPMPDPAVEFHAIAVEKDQYEKEAAFVAGRIREMLNSGTLVRDGKAFRPVKEEDIVILLRSPNSIGKYFSKALEERGIRCVSGGGEDLLKTKEIATFRSLLQTVYNPRLDIPLLSTLASPLFGFSADDLAVIRSGRRNGSVYESLLDCDLGKARRFVTILTELRKIARLNTLTALLEHCMAVTRMDSIYGAMEGGDVRMANLHTFYSLAADFEASNHRDLGQFLDHLEAMSAKGLQAPGMAASGAVTIMSIHKSKGLEFPVVFLAGLSRRFNTDSLKAQILCDKKLGLGLSVTDQKLRVRYPSVAKLAIKNKLARESLSEEMRVLYVAMTRPKDRLIMTYATDGLEKQLKDIALRRDFDGGAMLCRSVSNPGQWILKAAMERIEAGELFLLGGRPGELKISDILWKITVTQVSEKTDQAEIQEIHRPELPEGAETRLRDALAFRYGHIAATLTPSKQTATQRKGRDKDAEAAESARTPMAPRTWRKPGFLQSQASGRVYGNAIHAAMQYIRYDACGDLEGIRGEILRLREQGFLTPEQGEMVDCEAIARFFATELGQKLRSGANCIREFKFSILDAGEQYGTGLDGEAVLLQGVVDCALLEDNGITVIDFKTDHVTEETLERVVARYKPQVQVYADALQRIYEMPVQAEYLYFFRLNRFVRVTP